MKSPTPQTQSAVVLKVLHRRAGLTVAGAFAYGICHLPSVVLRLRRAGHCIEAVWHSGINRYGQPCRFKKYRAISNQK